MKKRKLMRKIMLMLACGAFLAIGNTNSALAVSTQITAPAETIVASKLDNSWDKKFPMNANVHQHKITFHNRFGITLVADMYVPKNMAKGSKLPAIALAGPYGAVKEQVSGRYAQELASRGFVTIAFDPSFTGESAGLPRNTTSPDINTEDFLAAVDYLSNCELVDADRVGILGICGWGGFALNAGAQDPRIKAIVASTMYDMSRVIQNGYFDEGKDPDVLRKERMAARKQLAEQRTKDYKNGYYAMAGGVPLKVSEKDPQFVRDYHSYYQTERGHHERSFGSTTGSTLSSVLNFMNAPINVFIDEIEAPVLLIHGEKAHSRYFSEAAFKKLQGKNKELLIVPGAVHTDLYDKMDVIPFDKIETFFKKSLK
ncbi:MAG: alpha/beta hydrolase [Phascolarctobacterium sp.]